MQQYEYNCIIIILPFMSQEIFYDKHNIETMKYVFVDWNNCFLGDKDRG